MCPDELGGGGGGPPSGEASAQRNRRPTDVINLVIDGDELPTGWAFADQRHVRFFVINLELVMNELRLQPANTGLYFKRAKKLIADQMKWSEQHEFNYECAKAQVSQQNRRLAKLFGTAATIIVGMEMAAEELRPGFNVYDYLRILPARHFVDRFDQERLDALIRFHAQITRDERARDSGPEFADTLFEATCFQKIGQNRPNVIAQLATGFCSTKFTANALMNFINERYPSELHVGPVRISGDQEAHSNSLGTKRAAPDLRVPSGMPLETLVQCF